MKLATYSPEVSRLRRVAKACAAGEMSRTEYRSVRRQLIAAMTSALAGADGLTEDRTLPRFMDETTVRRILPLRRRTDEGAQRQPWLWFLLACLVFVGMSVPAVGWAQSAAKQAGQTIPSVAKRGVGNQANVRYAVDVVQWQPDDQQRHIEVDVATANELLAVELERLRMADEVGAHGFGLSELDQIGRFLNAIGVHDARTELTLEDLEDLQALVAVQKERRGLTAGQLQELADHLQGWLRDQGYPLAVAFVPSQNIVAGVVNVAAMTGVVGDVVLAQSSTGVTSKQGRDLTEQLSGFKGETVRRRDIETRLNILNRNPSYSVQAGFQPGQMVGETELNVHVRRAQTHEVKLQVDNYGQEAIGEERLSLELGRSDLARTGDRLNARLNTSIESGGEQFGGLEYMTLVSGDTSARASIARSDVSIGRGLSAEGLLIDTAVIDTQVFTRQYRSELMYSAGWHDVTWDDLGDQRTWYVGGDWAGHRLWDAQKFSLDGSVGLRVGGVDNSDGQQVSVGSDDSFWLVHGSLQGWTPVSVKNWIEDGRVVLRSRFQWSTDSLPATQRFAAVQASGNSGLPVGSLFTDSALELGAELRVPQRFARTKAHWLMSLDTMFGEDHGRDTWQHLTSFSLGFETSLTMFDAQPLLSRISLGYPLSHKSNGVLEDDGLQIYWRLLYAR
ncbi:MAG: hypothetical protein GKR90_21885 [Pseudomonadales bacterium]|nr:hypothetical protein [Pseudomonadales bacterium]